jgi:hypothetical protein
MTDFDPHTQNKSSSQYQDPNRFQNLKDQATDAGASKKQRAGDALRASADVARDKLRRRPMPPRTGNGAADISR